MENPLKKENDSRKTNGRKPGLFVMPSDQEIIGPAFPDMRRTRW